DSERGARGGGAVPSSSFRGSLGRSTAQGRGRLRSGLRKSCPGSGSPARPRREQARAEAAGVLSGGRLGRSGRMSGGAAGGRVAVNPRAVFVLSLGLTHEPETGNCRLEIRFGMR